MGFDAPSPGREDPSGLLAMQMRDGAGKLHAQEPLAENGEDPGVGKALDGGGRSRPHSEAIERAEKSPGLAEFS